MDDDEYDGKLSEWKTLCKNGTVVELKKTKKVQLLVWNFLILNLFLKLFKEIFIMIVSFLMFSAFEILFLICIMFPYDIAI